MKQGRTMTAVVFLGRGRFEVRRAPVPSPGEGEVLLKVVACGVCGTDFHICAGEYTEGVSPPIVIGHEIAARVEEAGPGVTSVECGQFCAVDPVIGCGVCAHCRRGEANLCAAPTIIGYKRNGGFAQYCLVPEGSVIPMDESVGPAGGVLCETLACVLRGYDRLEFRAGSSAMVLGAGTVGLLWMQLLKHSLCTKRVQTDLAAFRRDKAEALGADAAIDPAVEGFERRVRDELPFGADFLIDATGDPGAIAQAWPLLAKGGTLMPFGCCPAGSTLNVDPSQIFSKELKIVGSKMPPGSA